MAEGKRGGGWMIPDGLAREIVRDEEPLSNVERGEIVNSLLRNAMGEATPIPSIFRAARETFRAYVDAAIEARRKYEGRRDYDAGRYKTKKGDSTRNDPDSTRNGTDSTWNDPDSTRKRDEGRKRRNELKEGMTELPSSPCGHGREGTRTGAAACGKDAAALPAATTPATQSTDTDSGALGTDAAQGAFEGLTHTDTQQKRADDAQAHVTARQTAQALRTRFGISADAPSWKSLVASMTDAARRMGWSGVVKCLNGCREELDCWETSRGEACFKFIADRMEGKR